MLERGGAKMSRMTRESSASANGEPRSVLRRTLEVWRSIHWRERFFLCVAVVVMCFASGANPTIALSLGRLVDAVNAWVLQPQRVNHLPGLPRFIWRLSAPATWCVKP